MRFRHSDKSASLRWLRSDGGSIEPFCVGGPADESDLRYLIAQYGWVRSAQILAFQSLIVVPMVLLLRKQTPKRPVPDETVADSKDTKPVQGNPLSATSAPAAATPAPRFESIPEPSTALLATKEAFTHLPVLLITTAYVSCGWTLGFISASLAASLQDRGFSADIAAWALSSIGIGSLFGTMLSGILPAAVSWITPKRLLSMVYTVRGILLFALAALPVSNPGLITVCVCLGLVWFSSIPPTTSLFAFICGTRWLGTISSVAFAVHQVGMFLGAYLGAVEYDQRGNYNICFWFTAGLSVVAGGVVAIVPGGSLRRREIVGGGDYVVLGSQEVVATEDVDKA